LRLSGFDVTQASPDSIDRAADDARVILVGWHTGQKIVDVCRRVRDRTEAPLIVLARGDVGQAEQVAAFEAGADEVLDQAVTGRELMAHVRAVLRRAERAAQPPALRVGDLAVYPTEFRATVRDADVPLRRQEFRLLQALARAPGEVVSREALADPDEGASLPPEAIESHVTRLRSKLRNSNVQLEDVPGAGFRLSAETDRRN
jgi:DNA-binding response OmpR family regulator